MTPTHEQLAMARRIAADTWGLTGPNRQAVINGEWDDIRQVRCALAAIIETTEAAAKLLEPYADSYAEMARISTDSRVGCRSVEADIKYNMIAALRADEHLKGQP